MSDDELAEIEKRCNATPRGPWMAHLKLDYSIVILTHVERAATISRDFLPPEIRARPAEWDVEDKFEYIRPCKEADVSDEAIKLITFVAHSKEDIAKLIAEVRDLKFQVLKLQSQLKQQS